MIQQDLIGFFNSVPHSRICSALQLMFCRLQEHFGQTADELAFQVDQRPANLRGTAKISGVQYQGATDSTCHGVDRSLVAISILRRSGHLLSDTRGLRGDRWHLFSVQWPQQNKNI